MSLVLAAGACWVTAAVAVAGSPAFAGGVALAAAVGTATALALRRSLIAWLLLGIAIGAAAAALHVHAVRASVVATFTSRSGAQPVELTLVRDPVELTGRDGFRFVLAAATVTGIAGRSDRAPVTVLAHGAGWLGLLPGQRLRVEARVRAPRPGDPVAATILPTGEPMIVGRPHVWQRAAGRVRAAFRNVTTGLPPDERGLVPGLVIGDTAAMPADLTAAFRASGLTHLILSIRHGKSGGHLHANLVRRARRGLRRSAPA